MRRNHDPDGAKVRSPADRLRSAMKVLLDFARSQPLRSGITLLCLLLAGVAEGIGLSSLFPVLELAAPDPNLSLIHI